MKHNPDGPKARATYILPNDQKVSADAASAFAAMRELQSKCQALQSKSQTDAKIAAYESKQKTWKNDRARRQRIEQSRQKASADQEYAARIAIEQQENLALGLVEVRVDSGKPWTRRWFDEELAHRAPDVRPELLDKDLGCLALLRAIDVLAAKRRRGFVVENPAGFVVHEARKAMAPRGGPTTWVTAEIAAQRPDLVVHRQEETFAGKVSARWQKSRNAMHQDEQRRSLGLLPVWSVDKARPRPRTQS